MSTLTLDFASLALPEGRIQTSILQHFAWLITAYSPRHVHNALRFLVTFINTSAFRHAVDVDGIVPYLAFSEARSTLGVKNQWQLHHARKLYRWCVDQGSPCFSREVANRLDDVVIGGNSKGQAVRSRDPDKGPLDDQEVNAITLALRAARAESAMPLDEQAALWLALTTGSNPSQYASMREEDLKPEKLGEQIVAWIIQVPRHKKGDVQHRAQFRDRRLHRFIGGILQDLVDSNARNAAFAGDDGHARPLFRRGSPLYGGDHPLREWAWHLNAGDFTRLLIRAVKRLRVLSRNGDSLRVSARRFRYSLATRLIANGGSAYAVADALDHSDLQNVPVYFDVHSGIVEHIDRAMAIALSPRAQAFARIVVREQEAECGDHKGSRRFFGDREKDIFEPIGTCGSNSFCNIVAPLACYTCVRFQPWMDGPHDLVLDALIEAREKRVEIGLAPKMVAIEDHVIVEVASVIARIAAMRVGDLAHG